MKILSMNVRGFGKDKSGDSKISWFRNLRILESPDVVAIQESKCNKVEDNWIEMIWGNINFEFIQKSKVGKSGGMLLIWDPTIFTVEEAIEKQYLLAIKGKWKCKEKESIIVNVYGPHNDEGKKVLRESLDLLLNYPDAEWVIGGDFNEVRSPNERQNCNFISSRAKLFNNFIDNNHLIEVPLVGKRYTRFSDDGIKLSKLDRFLVSGNFIQTWGDISTIALDRGTSDHCPLILWVKTEDFGPKPFKTFNVWFKNKEVEQIIIDAWKLSWLIKDDLRKAIEWSWSKGEISKGCNASFFSLILKRKDPVNLGDYRPISLIGSYYKIFSKILATRLQKVIHKVIGPEQCAFIKERYILDGIIIVNESYQELRRQKRKGFLFKADFEKAFDTINWEYLLTIIRKMGFGVKWLSLIRACLNSTSISILVNGSPTHEFTPQRGVRQGDPLSPYLFIIAVEGLNSLIKHAIESNLYNGIEIGRYKVLVSHLQYVDDTIFFGEWSRRNMGNLFKLLKCFEIFSGLKVNFSKSCLYGVGLKKESIEAMANYIGCRVGTFPFMHLGLPIGQKMNRLHHWEFVIEKFKSRLVDWKAKSMFFGGRLTLIKSVLSSLPLYAFSLFRVPSNVINALEGIRRKFFWGGSDDKSKISWVRWDTLLLPYEKGGLNIGSLKAKNLALLGKWWWRFRVENNAFWVKIIKSLYGREGGLGSFDNNSTLNKQTIRDNIRRIGTQIDELNIPFTNSFMKVVSTGDETLFWKDKWFDKQVLETMFNRLFKLELNKEVLVKDRLHKHGSSWTIVWEWSRSPSGRTQNELVELTTMLNYFKYADRNSDSWECKLQENGLFTTRKLATLIDAKLLPNNENSEETLRNPLLPQKVGLFVWRARRHRLPVRTELDKRGIDLDSVRCPVCDEDIETVEHILTQCKFAKDIWSRVHRWWNKGNHPDISIDTLFRGHVNMSTSNQPSRLWQAIEWTCGYIIWRNRNERVFRKKSSNGPMPLNEIQIKSFEWISSRSRKQPIDWNQWLLNPSSYIENV
ncbi:uncharacterized protein [Rutidosis leptorrhynchoides]|uniref:uncharacterized protein n=1 Tax=Rutidosis leptorrhynchoides TaxID=125765 RepID=UPI003A99C06E